MLESFILSGLRIKKRPASTPVSNAFEGEWNSDLYYVVKKFVELLLKESEEAVSVLETEIILEIKRSDSTNKILDLEKKHKERKEQLEKRRK